MLILTRKVGESIVIDGGKIVVKLHSINGKQVKLAIQAPKEIKILRDELIDEQPKGSG